MNEFEKWDSWLASFYTLLGHVETLFVVAGGLALYFLLMDGLAWLGGKM